MLFCSGPLLRFVVRFPLTAGTSGGASCGNGKTEGSETCDDGNPNADDGCGATCTVETGWVCTGSPSVCAHPSCVGLAKTCGPSGNADCCTSPVVPGIATATYYRSYDNQTTGYTAQSYPAKVSDFRLDMHEVTVGRFRKFVEAPYHYDIVPQGAGANPNNPDDKGWDAANLNAGLPATPAQLKSNLAICTTYSTWKDTAGTASAESLPIDCVNWNEAEAFCIWDGGRLPTEAEWNYAASGEWVQDLYANPYSIIPCNNCAHLTSGTLRANRGGSYYLDTAKLLSSARDTGADRNYDTGLRCARNVDSG